MEFFLQVCKEFANMVECDVKSCGFKLHLDLEERSHVVALKCKFKTHGSGNACTDKYTLGFSLCKALVSSGAQTYLVNERRPRHWDRTAHYL